MRILLVDDNQAASTGIVWLLVDEGFEVDVLDCGRGVYGMVAASRPDALILDVGLPDVDGVTVADNVHRTWPDLPIILTTGHADYPGLKRALATPGTSLLRKPYAFEVRLPIRAVQDIETGNREVPHADLFLRTLERLERGYIVRRTTTTSDS